MNDQERALAEHFYPDGYLCVDAEGYVWRDNHDGTFSMARTNSDNSPVPQPVTYFVRQSELVHLAADHAAAANGWLDRIDSLENVADALMGERDSALSEVAQLKAELEQVRAENEEFHRFWGADAASQLGWKKRADAAEENLRRLTEAARRVIETRPTWVPVDRPLRALAAALSEAPATEGSAGNRKDSVAAANHIGGLQPSRDEAAPAHPAEAPAQEER